MEGGPPASSSMLMPPGDPSVTAGEERPAHSDISLGPESSLQRPIEYSMLTPSARTSYTRVDLSAADIGRRGGREGAEQDDDRSDSDSGAGGQEQQATQEVEPVPHMPQVSLTFLLVSGRRRTMSFDHEITIGRVKELVWNAWPNGAFNSVVWLLPMTSFPLPRFTSNEDWAMIVLLGHPDDNYVC